MPLLVVILVAAALLGYAYFSSLRKARRAWLVKLDLLGIWHWQEGNAQLALSGQLSSGQFVYFDGEREQSGNWRLQGHQLQLTAQDDSQAFELHYFKPGQIGLEDNRGLRRVFVKETSNVVPLHRH